MILENKIFENVERNIPKDSYNTLTNRRRRIMGEDKKIR